MNKLTPIFIAFAFSVGLILGRASAAIERTSAIQPSVEVENYHGFQAVRANFKVDASSTTAYNVLTDYDNLPKFVSSMEYSHVLQLTENEALVEQEAIVKAFIFKKRIHVTLAVIEDRDLGFISFHDVAARDFVSYNGYWQVIPSKSGKGSTICYEVTSEAKFKAPVPLSVVKKNIERLLIEVGQEMERRSL